MNSQSLQWQTHQRVNETISNIQDKRDKEIELERKIDYSTENKYV